jgi:hypothetical protein
MIRWIDITRKLDHEEWYVLLELIEVSEWKDELYWEDWHCGQYSYDDWAEDKYFVQLPGDDGPSWIERNELYSKIKLI